MSNKKKLAIAFSVFTVSVIAVLLSAAFIYKKGGEAPKILGLVFILGCAGCAASLIVVFMVVFTAIYQDRKKAKALQAAGLEQVRAEDVNRKPIAYDDEEGFKKFEEYTKKFFANIVYPQGFIEFLKRYTTGLDGDTLEKEEISLKRFISRNGEYYGMADVYAPTELIEINNDILLYSDDYHTQFRNILFFADDESGHCHFLLDYGKGVPKVKYLDDEIDVVVTLADSFEEFTRKLTDEPKNIN